MSKIPEIDIKITSIPITSQTRKLKAKWSPELAQDLSAYQAIDEDGNVSFPGKQRFSMKNYLFFTDKTALGESMNWLSEPELYDA